MSIGLHAIQTQRIASNMYTYLNKFLSERMAKQEAMGIKKIFLLQIGSNFYQSKRMETWLCV